MPHEDYGTVLWWHLPVEEPPVCGSDDSLADEGYPEGWHTHWSPLPDPRFMTATDGVKVGH